MAVSNMSSFLQKAARTANYDRVQRSDNAST